jgi:hypothetical protein
VDSGKKIDDLVSMPKGEKATTTVKLAANVKNWTGDTLPAQVKDAYEELMQGKPHGEILGGQ